MFTRNHKLYKKYTIRKTMKQQTKRFINLQYIIDLKNYRESFEKWIKIRSHYHPTDQTRKDELFNKYLQVVKPVIHRFSQVIQFQASQYGFYTSNLTHDQIQIIRKIYKPLRQFDIITDAPQNLLENERVENLLQKNWKQIYRINLQTKPTNLELQWWGEGINIDPIEIEGIVVTGKGQGRKNLGMPTANIELCPELQKKLYDYPNGVYLVDFNFVNGQNFHGAGCLGTNPHYENFQESRRIEVYVLHDFGDELFYGSKVKVSLRRLIRFEGKFHSFDAFLQAMHNDIYIAGSFLQSHL